MIMPSTRLDSDINLRFHSKSSGLRSKAQKFFEENSKVQTVITCVVLLGTCMLIGDGALTPAISGTPICISRIDIMRYAAEHVIPVNKL